MRWAAPANRKKEGATQHSGTCKHSWQHDRSPDRRLEEQVGKWNLGSVSGKGRKEERELLICVAYRQ